MPKVEVTYDEGSLRQQGDLEHIQQHPGMYLGSCQTPWNALKEVIDNGVDEHIAGHVKELYIQYNHKTKEILVCDDGRGIPVGKHPQLGISTLIAVFTKQRFGGKFNRVNGAYNTSVGTHGIGTKATNALAAEFEVWTYQGNKWYHVLFKDGKPTTKDPEVVSQPLHLKAPFNNKGTQVRVKPGKQYFTTLDIDVESLQERCSDISFLCPGLRVTLNTGKEKVYESQTGLVDLIDGVIKVGSETVSLKKLHAEPFYVKQFSTNGTGVECVLQWTNGDDEQIYSYVNVSDTIEHGVHYDGLCDAINEVISKSAKKSQDFDPEDIRTGLFGALHLMHKNPHFKSQTKEKLVDPVNSNIRHDVYLLLVEPIRKFFRKFPELIEELIKKACELKKARTSFKDKKMALRGLELRKGARGLLPGKLATASKCKPEERELFLVEGDSAGGSAVDARDHRFQEVLPLRGKTINSSKYDDGSILKNTEIRSIIQAVGADIREKCDPERARVGKILIMADADPDGYHISSLLISFFTEFYRPLIEKGMVYVVDSPLFKASVGDKHAYGRTLAQVKNKLGEKLYARAAISRFKGLGESDASELREYGMSPVTRRLYRIVLRGPKDVILLREIMGKDTNKRKEILFGADA